MIRWCRWTDSLISLDFMWFSLDRRDRNDSLMSLEWFIIITGTWCDSLFTTELRVIHWWCHWTSCDLLFVALYMIHWCHWTSSDPLAYVAAVQLSKAPRNHTIQFALLDSGGRRPAYLSPVPAMHGGIEWPADWLDSSVQNNAGGIQMNRPIELRTKGVRLGESCTTCQIWPPFPTYTPVYGLYIAAVTPLHVKFGRPFRHMSNLTAFSDMYTRLWFVYCRGNSFVRQKFGRPFRHALPFLLCQSGVRAWYHVLFLIEVRCSRAYWTSGIGRAHEKRGGGVWDGYGITEWCETARYSRRRKVNKYY